jgi:hypothetical protein
MRYLLGSDEIDTTTPTVGSGCSILGRMAPLEGTGKAATAKAPSTVDKLPRGFDRPAPLAKARHAMRSAGPGGADPFALASTAPEP